MFAEGKQGGFICADRELRAKPGTDLAALSVGSMYELANDCWCTTFIWLEIICTGFIKSPRH